MDIIIQHPSTWYNLNRLRDYAASPHFNQKKISVLIDCLTGDIYIPQSINELESRIHGTKKERDTAIGECRHAQLEIQSASGKICFELSTKELPLEDRAALVVKETLTILNQVGERSHTAMETLRHCMRDIKLELPLEITTHSGWWGALNRSEAEKLLMKEDAGTFLLREGDEETKRLEWTLQKKNRFPVRCYVLTVVEDQRKIADKVLVQRASGWAFYNDNLSLSNCTFKDLNSVTASCGGKRPYKMLRKAA